MKKTNRKLLLILLIPTLSFPVVPCRKEVPYAKTRTTALVVKLTSLVSEMKALDDTLSKITEALDKTTKSQGLGFSSSMGAANLSRQITVDTGRVMQAEGIIAKGRLNYLKASLARLQFQFSKDISDSIKKFEKESE